jgi:hypothetical protein
VGLASAAGVGRQEQLVGAFRVVQCIEQAGRHARGVAKSRMTRHVGDPFAVDVDLTTVAERLQIFLAGLTAIAADGADCLRALSRRSAARRVRRHGTSLGLWGSSPLRQTSFCS